MPPTRPTRRPPSLLLLLAAASAAACLDGSTDPKTATATFGPESLLVYVTGPDTVPAGTQFRVTAVAHNETLRPIVATLQCPTAGLTLRVVDAADQVLASTTGGCTPGDPARTSTFQVDDSVVTTLTGRANNPGTLRVQAAYEAVNGRSSVAERPMVVRAVAPSSTAPRCTNAYAYVSFGLYVGVTDARTGATLSASVVATDSAGRAEGLAPGPGAPGQPAAAYYGLAERSGTYSVTVSAPGYKPWRRDGVVVSFDSATCHVRSEHLSAALEPAL